MQAPGHTITARYVRAAMLGIGSVVAAVVMTWPLATGIGTLGRSANSGDARFTEWNVAWVAYATVARPENLLDANIFHPHKLTLAYSELNLVAGALAIPVWWLTKNPHAATNVVILFSFAATLMATWLLTRHLFRDTAAAATAAVLFAFCPFVFSHTAHIQLLMTAGMPLALLAMHRLVDDPSPGRGALLGLVLAVQALACAYYGIFAGLLVALGALFYATTRRCWRSLRYWTAWTAGLITSIALVFPFFLPYAELQRETGFHRSLADAVGWSAYFRSYLASAAHAHSWMLGFIRDWHGEVLFPGFVAVGLALVGVYAALERREPDARDRSVESLRETLAYYAVAGVLAFWASLGPRAGLYTLLYETIPVFSLLRAPGRTGIIVTLACAVIAAAGVRRLRRRPPARSTAVGIACCTVALLDLNGIPIDWRQSPPIPQPYSLLAQMPRGPVAEFPFYERRIDFHIHTIYLLNSTVHWFPLLNGYSDYIPPDFRELAVTLASFPSPESFAAMKQRRTRYIVIHRELYGREVAPVIEERLRSFLEYLRPVADDGRVAIYEITAWPK
jgi:4-amino-4-deoxy-L-arabinose transferase-like glycosyltransferase